MGGSSDPSMILYRTKLIEKVGPIEGGSEAFNWTRGGSGRALFSEARLNRNQQILVLRGRSENHSVPLAARSQTSRRKQEKNYDFTNHFGLIIPLLSSIPIKDIDFR